MKDYTIQDFIKRFDWFCKDIDWQKVPTMDEQERNTEMLRVTNNDIFVNGRMCTNSEMTLELLDIEEVRSLVYDLKAISSLTDQERQRFIFYRDLAETFNPLYHHHPIDLGVAPFRMKDDRFDIANDELYQWIADTPYKHVAAVVLEVLIDVFEAGELSNSVAYNTLNEEFYYGLKSAWPKTEEADYGEEKEAADTEKTTEEEAAEAEKKAEEVKKFEMQIAKMLNQLWKVHNHMELGRRMGMDHLAQELYDAFDTFIYDVYNYEQVDAAKELAIWIREHWPMGEKHPSRDQFYSLDKAIQHVSEKYHLQLNKARHIWNIITYDILNVSMSRKKKEMDADYDIYDDDELGD